MKSYKAFRINFHGFKYPVYKHVALCHWCNRRFHAIQSCLPYISMRSTSLFMSARTIREIVWTRGSLVPYDKGWQSRQLITRNSWPCCHDVLAPLVHMSLLYISINFCEWNSRDYHMNHKNNNNQHSMKITHHMVGGQTSVILSSCCSFLIPKHGVHHLIS